MIIMLYDRDSCEIYAEFEIVTSLAKACILIGCFLVYQYRPNGFLPELIAFFVHVDVVFDEYVGPHVAVFVQHGRGNIDKCQQRVIRADGFDRVVGRLHIGPDIASPDTGFDGKNVNAGIRESLMDLIDKSLEAGDVGFRRNALCYVVVAFVEKDRPRLIVE